MQTYQDPHAARWTTMQADYRETLAHVASLGGADLVATSPPYCDARTYGAGVSWTDAEYAALGDAVFVALKPGGHALINVDAPVRDWTGDGRGTERGLHPWRLMLDWHDRIGFRVVDRLAFGRMGLPGAYHGRFRNDWEPLLWFQRPGADGWHNKKVLAEPALFPEGPRKSSSVGRTSKGTMLVEPTSGHVETQRGTMWQYGNIGGGHTGAPDIEAENHPARWPYKLAEDIVRCFCPPDGLVVDPFCGAGTTGAAAIAHGRRFVGGDLFVNAKGEPWASVAHRIMVERTKQQSLFGGMT